MADLATVDDVEAFLGRSLTDAESDRVDALLTQASALVRSYTGQAFEPTDVTRVERVRDSRVRLRHQPVNSVASVKSLNDQGEPTQTLLYRFDGIDTVYVGLDTWVVNAVAWCGDTVSVTYNHGTEEAPADVVAVVVGAVSRQLLAPADDVSGLRSVTIGGYTESYQDAFTSGSVFLTQDDKATLDGYRTGRQGTMRLGSGLL